MKLVLYLLSPGKFYIYTLYRKYARFLVAKKVQTSPHTSVYVYIASIFATSGSQIGRGLASNGDFEVLHYSK